MDRWKDGQTDEWMEAITISPSLFLKKSVGINVYVTKTRSQWGVIPNPNAQVFDTLAPLSTIEA